MSLRVTPNPPWSAVPGVPVLHRGLFLGKLLRPPPVPGLLDRPRLDALIDDAVDAGSLIVSAPAGAGKTQAVLAWTRRQRSPRAVAWLTLDEGDRDPVRLLRYLVAAMAGTPPGGQALGALSVAPGTTSVDEALLVQVSTAMARLQDDVVLVLDDFDAVVGSAAEELLAKVLRYPPQQVRLVVLGRVEPGLGQSRLRLLGYVRELDETDLAFTHEELTQLLVLRGRPLPTPQTAELLERTVGWAAGIGIVAAALHHRALPEGVHEGVSLATDYLLDEVLAAQPPDVQTVLIRAATADPVCGDLVDALGGGPDGGRTLARLHHDHLFLGRLDDREDERTWYHWHPLFRAALQARALQTEPAATARRHLLAARWHREAGSAVEAVRHALAGGDPGWAAALLGESWVELAVAGESALVRSLLHLFDEDLRSTQPELAVVCSFLRLRDRDLEDAARCATTAASLSHRLPPGRRQDTVRAMSTVIRLHVATLTGELVDGDLRSGALEQIDRLGGRGGYLPRRERELLALLLHHLGAYEGVHLLGDPRERLERALDYAQDLGTPELVLRTRAQLALAELAAGRLHAARRWASEVVTAEREGRGPGPHATTAAHAALGGVELLQGQLAGALQHLSQALDDLEPADRVNHLRVLVLTHSTLLTLDRVSSARSQLDTLEDLVADREPPAWGRAMLRVLQVDQMVAEGHHGDALDQLRLEHGPPDPGDQVIRATWQGDVLRRAGRPEEARSLLRGVLRTGGRSPAMLFAQVSFALVEDALGCSEEALDELDRALVVSSSESLIYPYLRLGRDVRPLLLRLLDRGTMHDELLTAVLDRLHPERPGGPLSWQFEPLTPREREVLRAVQGWATNEEVAARMFISANTLRTHMKHIHRKLGTTSRREAVVRGRDLGII
ncbi:LuxR C-terminal-related transcriptional regulator [Ornithinimicrobium sp. W1665]|uniref:helix-turn-helix transcriptional regulator n=1 Tax=Ornithinimicrobium sp. W1665 TaxID=3416666 RepID=UPI003CF0BB7B